MGVLNSSLHLAPHHIINPKPYKNWNTFWLWRVVPLASRIARKTTRIVSLHCNIHLNAMVRGCNRRAACWPPPHLVPSKLLSWITLTTFRLESITNKGLMEGECDYKSYASKVSWHVWIDGRGPEAEELATQLALSLSLIQGVALNHESSKIYLGRKCSLEVNIIIFTRPWYGFIRSMS